LNGRVEVRLGRRFHALGIGFSLCDNAGPFGLGCLALLVDHLGTLLVGFIQDPLAQAGDLALDLVDHLGSVPLGIVVTRSMAMMRAMVA
jgi:hypothetical protein